MDVRVVKPSDEVAAQAARFFGEFDPGSGLTLAACMRHASRTDDQGLLWSLVADG